MVTALTNLLDDTGAGAGFYTTAMYYEALSAGQRGAASFINKNNPTSPVLKSLLKEDTVTGGYSADLPGDFVAVNSATYAYDGSTYKPCKVVEYAEHLWNIENPFLVNSKNRPVIYIKGESTLGGKYYFYPTNSSTSNGVLTYLAEVTDIASGVDPVIKQGHDAMVQYALHYLLKRNKDEERAKLAYSEFERLASLL